MDTSGNQMFGKLVIWIMLIVFLISVVIVLYGDKGLLEKAGEGAIWLQRYLPHRSESGGVAENPKSVEVRDKLLGIMEAKGGSSFCALDIKSVDFGDLQNDRIIFKNDGTGLTSLIQTTSVGGRKFLDDRGAQTIEEEDSIARVCIANTTRAFNLCYSGGGSCSTSLGVSVGQIKVSRKKIHVVNPTTGDLKDHDFFDDYLFKTSSDLYCFLPTYGDLWPGCNDPKEDDGFWKMDKGCINNLKETINRGIIAKC
tara:strand:- start:46 stop:807 length:762 start_codon:yes stop_codon:yes gene_type:complete